MSAGRILRQIITQPPNTLKSSIVAVCWPAWHWVDRPFTRFLYASNDGPLATRDAVAMRDLVLSRWYQESFRPRWSLKEDQDQKTWFANTAGGHRISYSVSAKVTGKKGDILVVDDANDARKVNSAVDRQGVIDWHDQAFSGRMADEKSSPEVVTGQRTHDSDLIGHLKRQGGWVELMLAEEYDPERRCVTPIWDKDPRTRKGEWLRPKRFGPAEKADRLKSLGTRGYSSQHQQNPLTGDGTLFKKDWFEPLRNESPKTAARVRYWDTASTDGDGCWTVGVLMAKDSDGVFWVEDVVRFQLSALGRDKLILATTREDRHRYGTVTTVVEQQPGGSGKDVAEATVRMLAGYDARADKVTGEKVARARPLSSQAEAGNVRVLDRPWAPAFIDGLCAAPHGEMDQCDAAGGAFTWVSPMHAGEMTVLGPLPGQGFNYELPEDVFR